MELLSRLLVMSLKNIFAQINSVVQYDLTKQRAVLLSKVNIVAEELWRENELIGSIREDTFAVNAAQGQIALPSYVENIRSVRHWSGTKINTQDMRPRYDAVTNFASMFNWRFRGFKPLALPIINASKLTFTLSKEEEKDVEITVIGRTPQSLQRTEICVIKAGDLAVTTEGNFGDDLLSITKKEPCSYDITITDILGNVLGVIPNTDITSRYGIYQLAETYFPRTNFNWPQLVEVLYKLRFKPLVNNNDEFLDGRYDIAIFYRFMENYCITQKDFPGAKVFRGKADEIVAAIHKDAEAGINMMLSFAPGKFYGLFEV